MTPERRHAFQRAGAGHLAPQPCLPHLLPGQRTTATAHSLRKSTRPSQPGSRCAPAHTALKPGKMTCLLVPTNRGDPTVEGRLRLSPPVLPLGHHSAIRCYRHCWVVSGGQGFGGDGCVTKRHRQARRIPHHTHRGVRRVVGTGTGSHP